MSNFIVPISSLPPIGSIGGTDTGQNKQTNGSVGTAFDNILQDAMQNLTTSGETSQQSMYNLALGASDDLHTGAIDAVRYSTAVNFTAGVASSVLRAYNELLRMQI